MSGGVEAIVWGRVALSFYFELVASLKGCLKGNIFSSKPISLNFRVTATATSGPGLSVTPDWSQPPSQNRLYSGICSRRRPRSTATAATADRVKFGLVLSLCFVVKTYLKTFPRVKPPKLHNCKRRCEFSAFLRQLDLTFSIILDNVKKQSGFARNIKAIDK